MMKTTIENLQINNHVQLHSVLGLGATLSFQNKDVLGVSMIK